MESENADVKWQRRLRVCWRDRDVLRYLSPAGKRLHQRLQIVLAVALVYCVMRHVVFADDQELFEGGADIGDLLFNFAAAYVVTYVFYVLVVRIPLVRESAWLFRLELASA